MAAYRPLFTSTGLILRNIMKTAQDSYTITIKQIVRFKERMHLKKFQVDKVKNGRLSAFIHSTGLILRNIMKTAQDSYIITIKQIVRFQERKHLEKFQVDKIQKGRLSAIIHLDRPDFEEYHENRSRCYTITIKQIVRFQERMHLEKF